MRELIETIDQLEKDLSDTLDKMMSSNASNTTSLMDKAGHLDWEIRLRTDALMKILRKQYATTI